MNKHSGLVLVIIKLWVFDKLLLGHVGLPLVVILTVHLVIFCAGWV